MVLQNKDDEQLKTVCAANIDKPVQMVVYSSKDQSVRGQRTFPEVLNLFAKDVVLVPSNTWGGEGLLGL
jgi:hypothetical protein